MTSSRYEFSELAVKDLKALMEETGITTEKELINNALTLLEWAIKERKAGRIIASIDETEKSYKAINMPILAKVSAVATA